MEKEEKSIGTGNMAKLLQNMVADNMGRETGKCSSREKRGHRRPYSGRRCPGMFMFRKFDPPASAERS
ncbi:hypothetical protein CLOM621_07308 [Clostridium sp. M62/1]|nr:hypothetical protein CLOM621_07308 [Clostridium sp. M62/1]